jgi:N-acetylglucosamine-6-sulfatase
VLALHASLFVPRTVTRVANATITGQPNIVLILTDDIRWDEMENMPTVQSELIAKGVNFTQAFVSNSLCCPSRSSTLTGQYSHTNGVWRNGAPYGGYKTFLPHESNTVATRLHAAGYTTGLVGKYMNGYNAKATRNPSDLRTGRAGTLGSRSLAATP